MPLYEYQCTNKDCLYIEELLIAHSDTTEKYCPHCKNIMSKCISQAGIIFKGSGWYCTDNRKK